MSGNENRLEFVRNRSSPNARKIIIVKHNLTIELWFDKHYYKRHHEGDNRGKRYGIDPDIVQSLLTRSIEHLIFYSTVCKSFNFANYANPDYINRIVLKEESNGSTLNIVIEAHSIAVNRFEITVMTAMLVDDFRMPEGQYCIELHQEYSILKKQENGKLSEIFSL